jgi:hypothetical protein
MPTFFRTRLLDDALACEGSDAVFDILARVTAGWDLCPSPGETGSAGITVARTRRGFVIREAGIAQRFEPTDVGAACSLVVAVLNRMAASRPDRLCLHAGAVVVDGRRLVFPSTHRAGKSTLVTALAIAGHRVVADDVLPLRLGEGPPVPVATGVSPRLRLPLPADIAPDPAVAVTGRLRIRDDVQGYVSLEESLLAPWSEPAPPDAFILLERTADESPSLRPLSTADLTRALLLQTFGGGVDEPRVLAEISALAASAPGYVLTYARLADAVRLLVTEDVRRDRPAVPARSLARATVAARGGPARLADPARLVRRAGVERREANGAAFLLDPDSGGLFGLDPLGDAIWELLAEPMSVGALCDTVAAVFPPDGAGRIRRDVGAFVTALRQKGLVVVVTVA